VFTGIDAKDVRWGSESQEIEADSTACPVKEMEPETKVFADCLVERNLEVSTVLSLPQCVTYVAEEMAGHWEDISRMVEATHERF
jgi:hypothetical protein